MEILLVTVDCLRPSRLGAYGCSAAATPAFDALAARGVLFDDVIAQSSWTSPALFSLLTGCNPPAHGVTSRGGRLGVTSLPDHFRRHGWETPDTCYLNAEESYRRLGWQPPLDLHEALRSSRPARLLWTHYERCHLPYAAPPPDPRLSPLHAQGVVPRGSFDLRPSDRDAVVTMYDAGVAAWDRWLAGVLEAWDGRGPVVLTADHGEELLEHGWVGHTSTAEWPTLHGEVLRIPLLVAAAGHGPRRVTTRVRQIDLAPTLCELAGLPPMAPLEGTSLSGLMAGAREPHRAAYAETVPAGFRTPPEHATRRCRALYEGAWKLIEEAGAVRLHHLADDPDELHDRADDEPAVAAALQARLRSVARASRTLWTPAPRGGKPLPGTRLEDGVVWLPDDRRYEIEYVCEGDVAGTLYAEGPRLAPTPAPLRCRARSVEGDDDWSGWLP